MKTNNATTNAAMADLLDRIGDLLAAKGENPFRIRSYRTAAASLRETKQSVAKMIADGGPKGVTGIKGVGEGLAGLLAEYVEKGEVELLQTLEKEVPPEKIKTASKQKTAHVFKHPIDLPVETILEIDADYREKAAAGKLKKIAPKKLNPEGKAWLPVLARSYKGYKFTVMFSNTATAHELGKTDDWVVVYYEKGEGENQCTVVTESRGALKGKRVIRGREKECTTHYGSGTDSPQ